MHNPAPQLQGLQHNEATKEPAASSKADGACDEKTYDPPLRRAGRHGLVGIPSVSEKFAGNGYRHAQSRRITD